MKALIATLILCAAVFIGAQVKPSQPVSTTQPGRYQIVINPTVRADTYLLDTQTGKVWRPITITDVVDKPSIWKFDEKVDNEAELMAWISRQTFIPKPTPTVVLPK